MSKTPRELFDPDDIYGDATKDRATALVGATVLDQTLETALMTHMITLDEDEHERLFGPNQNAPLSSFSAKIKLGYVLRIYGPKFRDDLDCIRFIRNAFAHVHSHIDFETPEIISACNELSLPKRSTFDLKIARTKYIHTAMWLSLSLMSGRKKNRPIILNDSEIFGD